MTIAEIAIFGWNEHLTSTTSAPTCIVVCLLFHIRHRTVAPAPAMNSTTDEAKDVHANLSIEVDQPPSYEPATSSHSSSSATSHVENNAISTLPLSFPDATATALEVRTYIRCFLYQNAANYELGPGDTIRIAGAWRYGSGEELRSYTQAMWDELFGSELGLVLSKHVQEQIAQEKEEKEKEKAKKEREKQDEIEKSPGMFTLGN